MDAETLEPQPSVLELVPDAPTLVVAFSYAVEQVVIFDKNLAKLFKN